MDSTVFTQTWTREVLFAPNKLRILYLHLVSVLWVPGRCELVPDDCLALDISLESLCKVEWAMLEECQWYYAGANQDFLPYSFVLRQLRVTLVMVSVMPFIDVCFC